MMPLLSSPLCFLAAALPERPSFAEISLFQMTGVLVVFAVLGFLTLAVKLAGMLFGAVPVSDSPPVHGSAAQESQTEAVPGPVVAAISAAVHLVLDEPYRITSIKPLSSQPGFLEWSKEGRRQIFSSHQIR